MTVAGTGDRQTLTVDGDTTRVAYVGPIRVNLSNDFGSGTAKIQATDPTGTPIDVGTDTFTAAADKAVNFPAGETNVVSVNLAGSTSPDLDVWIQGNRLGQ